MGKKGGGGVVRGKKGGNGPSYELIRTGKQYRSTRIKTRAWVKGEGGGRVEKRTDCKEKGNKHNDPLPLTD